MKLTTTIILAILYIFPTAAEARSHSGSHASRGGNYSGGQHHGSSHKGGSYRNSKTNNHYTKKKS